MMPPGTDTPADAPDDAHTWRVDAAFIRGLVERVVLHPIGGGFTLELVGQIARTAALGMNDPAKKTAASLGEAAGSVKVVAGTRIGRDRHSLVVPI
jgi:hypothetical protein